MRTSQYSKIMFWLGRGLRRSIPDEADFQRAAKPLRVKEAVLQHNLRPGLIITARAITLAPSLNHDRDSHQGHRPAIMPLTHLRSRIHTRIACVSAAACAVSAHKGEVHPQVSP